jgi:STE24 endopeptidase
MATTTAVDIKRSGISPWKAYPADPADWFSAEEIDKAKRYLTPLRRVTLIDKSISFALLLGITGLHVAPNLLDALDVTNWVVRLLITAVLLDIVGTVASVGFDAWRELSYDKRWEFSTQTTKGFVTDLLKSFAIGLVLNPLIYIPLWAIIRATDLWWLWGWVVVSFFSVVLGLVIAPMVIMPIFNKFTKLDDDEFHDALIDLGRSVDADLSEIQVSDASRRTRRDNAFVTGAGKARRLVLFDTLLARPREQIRSVAAHEIGHWKLRHVVRQVPVGLIALLANFVVLKLVIEADWALEFAGVDSLEDPAALPLFSLVFPLTGAVTSLVQSYFSRAAEREADLFALEVTDDPQAAADMERALHIDNLADLAPSRWKRLNRSHPPPAERLAMIEGWRRARAGER